MKLLAAGSGGGEVFTSAKIRRNGWPDLRIESACTNDKANGPEGCRTLAWFDGERYRSYKDKPPPQVAALRSTGKAAAQPPSFSAAAKPTLQPADFSAFEAAALCRDDPRAILSRMPPSAGTSSAKVYQPPPGLTVNGWPVLGVYYRLMPLQTGGYVHLVGTFVRAPPAQVLAWARTLPHMSPTPVTGDAMPPNSEIARLAAAGGVRLQLPAAEYGTTSFMSSDLADRAREVERVFADSGETGVIICGQIDASALPAGSIPSSLGPMTRVAAAPDLSSAFLAGDFKIATSAPGGCKGLYAGAAELDAAMQRDDWNLIARRAISLSCKADITYFLLGRAAEAMGQAHAASSYYAEAARIAGTPTFRFSEQCALNRSGARTSPGPNGCHGIAVGDEAKGALLRIVLTPPTLGPYPLLSPSNAVAQAQSPNTPAPTGARASAPASLPRGFAPPRFRQEDIFDPDAPRTHRAPTDCEFREAMATVAGARAGPSRCKAPPAAHSKGKARSKASKPQDAKPQPTQ